MNWYKIAQESPQQMNILDFGHTWIDPSGRIFTANAESGFPHRNWVQRYRIFLNQNYDLDLKSKKIVDNPDILIANGWILAYRNSQEFNFDINSKQNYKALKIIEQNLYDVLDENSDEIILIYTQEGFIKGAQFTWQYFLRSNENFVDFAQHSFKRNYL